MIVYHSLDGLSYSHLFDEPILRLKGAFDPQNLAFWDPKVQRYRGYWRVFSGGKITDTEWKPEGVRAIRTDQSDNLRYWDHLADLTFENSPDEHLYTNGVQPYHPAPHILIGLTTRYI